MRKIVFTSHTGYCGMDGHAFQVFPDDVTEDTLNEEAYRLALENAEMYGIYPEEDRPDDFDEDEDGGWGSDQYSMNIEGYWEDYCSEEHDGLSTPGFSVSDFFKNATI